MDLAADHLFPAVPAAQASFPQVIKDEVIRVFEDQQTAPFWKRKTLEEMTPAEWEALCDGCGWCCLYHLMDEESGAVLTTAVACRLLDLKTCRCKDYPNRFEKVSTCVRITPLTARTYTWLPETCAYRLLALGKDLPDWHPLITGDPRSVHRAGASALGRAISELGVDLNDLENYILDEE